MSSFFASNEQRRQQEVDSSVAEWIYHGCIKKVGYGEGESPLLPICPSGSKHLPHTQAGWRLRGAAPHNGWKVVAPESKGFIIWLASSKIWTVALMCWPKGLVI